MSWFERFAEFVEDQPSLIRSALWGGTLLFGWTLFRSLLLLPAAGREAIGPAAIALVLATAGGAGGGFVHGLLRPLGRAGAVGEWLRWAAGGTIYLAVVAVVAVPGDPLMQGFFTDPEDWAVAGVLIAAYAALGTWLFYGIPSPSIKARDTRSAEQILNDAVEADLGEVAKDMGRIDLIEKRTPSQAYLMHLWRVIGRLGRLPAPTRQERIALKRAKRLLREVEKEYEWDGVSQESGTEGA